MSWMKNIPTMMPNTADGRVAGEEWIEFNGTNGYPTLCKRLYTHGVVTKGVPYMYQSTAAHPGGLTAACATNPRAFVGVALETTTGAAYAKFAIAGFVKDAATGDVAAGANLEVINSGVTLIDDGSTSVQTANTIGKALEADDTYATDVWLYESPVAIASS
jgi:hypothetical protein